MKANGKSFRRKKAANYADMLKQKKWRQNLDPNDILPNDKLMYLAQM